MASGTGGGGADANGQEEGADDVKLYPIHMQSPNDARHHVELFQELLFALPLDARRCVLPTEAMGQCTTPEALRWALVTTAPFHHMVATAFSTVTEDGGKQMGADDWKALFVDRCGRSDSPA